MNCKKYQDLLLDYASNDLFEFLRDDVANHLQHCSSCSREFHNVRLFAQLLEEDRSIMPPPFIHTRVKGQLQRRAAFWKWSSRLQPVAYALMLSAAIYSGIWMGSYFADTNDLLSQDITNFVNEIRFETIEQAILE